jgi:hypothetical protein
MNPELERTIANDFTQALRKGVYQGMLEGLSAIKRHVLTPEFVSVCLEDAQIAPANIADHQRSYLAFLSRIEDVLRRQIPW